MCMVSTVVTWQQFVAEFVQICHVNTRIKVAPFFAPIVKYAAASFAVLVPAGEAGCGGRGGGGGFDDTLEC